MNNPMFIWYAMVALVLVAFFVQLIQYLRDESVASNEHPRIFGSLKEREIFYVPGDSRCDDEDDDFRDL